MSAPTPAVHAVRSASFYVSLTPFRPRDGDAIEGEPF